MPDSPNQVTEINTFCLCPRTKAYKEDDKK